MKMLFAAVLFAVLTSSSAVQAQAKPDFSGSWKMDPSRSESAAQNEPIGPVTLVMAQTPGELKIETTRGGGKTTVTYRLDGSTVTIAGGTAVTRWEGPALITDRVLSVQGQTVTTKETRTLSADGNEMLVDNTVVVQHGYPDTLKGTQNYVGGKDIYVRVR